MQHGSFRVLIRGIYFGATGVFIERLSLDGVVVIVVGSGVFIIEMCLIIGMSLCPKKGFA